MKSPLSFALQPELQLDLHSKNHSHPSFNGRSGAFVDNMSLPVHRWYRYSAGFSADWVRYAVRHHCPKGCSHPNVLDPFAGVGTTLLACEAEGLPSFGMETHPFVLRIARAKLRGIHADPIVLKKLFEAFCHDIATLAPGTPDLDIGDIPPLLSKCYDPESLGLLLTMKNLYLQDYDNGAPENDLLWLAITTILRTCSGAGTAQWQYILPNKKKSNVLFPLEALHAKATEMLSDISYAQGSHWSDKGTMLNADARAPHPRIRNIDMVVTSPPYPNNYDYADATRLEMTFWGEVTGWCDLQGKVRKHLIRSCSQHASAEKLVLESLLQDPVLQPIQSPLSDACHRLAEIRLTKGGRKQYHTMAAAYFRDLGLVFQSLRDECRPGCIICFVIGDSAPYGVYLDVDNWLGEMALKAGFRSYRFEKIRDRNIKWKNRKHRVPLKEGRLWIEG